MSEPSPEISIRVANLKDLEAIATLALQLFPSNFRVEGQKPLEEARRWVIGNMAGVVYSAYLIAEIEGKGTIGYTHSRTTAHAAGVVAIDEWGAIKVEGIKGIGTRLIEETERLWVERHAVVFGKPLTSLLVYTGEPGVNLCRKLGFVEAPRMKDLYGQGVDELIMRKDFKVSGSGEIL